MRATLVMLIAAVALVGCGSDAGQVTDESLQNAKVKTDSELPGDMPPQAKAAADAAAGSAQMRRDQMVGEASARTRAMEEMQKQRGR